MIDDVAACQWIAMADTPSDPLARPWNGKPVLIYTDHQYYGRIHRAVWTDAVHGHNIYGWAVEDCKHGPYALRGYMKVTHWMPLPEPPRSKDAAAAVPGTDALSTQEAPPDGPAGCLLNQKEGTHE